VRKPDYDYYKWHDNRDLTYSNDVLLPVYLRYNTEDELAEFGFSNIRTQEKFSNGGYVLGNISLSNLWSLNGYIEERGIMVIAASLLKQPLGAQTSKEKLVVTG
jgi:hypothetical protein